MNLQVAREVFVLSRNDRQVYTRVTIWKPAVRPKNCFATKEPNANLNRWKFGLRILSPVEQCSYFNKFSFNFRGKKTRKEMQNLDRIICTKISRKIRKSTQNSDGKKRLYLKACTKTSIHERVFNVWRKIDGKFLGEGEKKESDYQSISEATSVFHTRNHCYSSDDDDFCTAADKRSIKSMKVAPPSPPPRATPKRRYPHSDTEDAVFYTDTSRYY